MTAECRPPEGTPDGTVFVLQRTAHYYNGPREVWVQAVWGAGWWHFGEGFFYTPEQIAYMNYSIATPPEGEG